MPRGRRCWPTSSSRRPPSPRLTISTRARRSGSGRPARSLTERWARRGKGPATASPILAGARYRLRFLAANPGRDLVHGVADAPRVVVGKGPHAEARPVDEAAPGGVEGIDHGEQHVAGDALVRDPVAVAAHAGQLVGALHAGHVDGDQALVAGQRLEIFARQLVEARASEP